MQLLPHPESAAHPVRQFDATAEYGPDGALRLTWRLTADLARLRMPPATSPGRADDLWRHTCFEAFVADPHSAGYVELNFSPGGAWAVYGFRGYRDGGIALPLRHEPVAVWQREPAALGLVVHFRMDSLPGPPGPRPPVAVRVAMAAVIEDDAGALSWWALRHQPGNPDFHHPDGFVLQVEP